MWKSGNPKAGFPLFHRLDSLRQQGRKTGPSPTAEKGTLLHFPGAVQIVDLYHARQHLWELVRRLYPNDEAGQKARIKVHQKRLLDKGKIEKLVAAIHSIQSANPEVAEKLRTEADYFQRNAERMRYPTFRFQHLFVGSGVIEAGCKTVIGSRLKRSGMRHARNRVLDRAGSQRDPRTSVLPPQRPL